MDFYFVDERGNTSIDFEDTEDSSLRYSKASKYFEIGVLKINQENLKYFQDNFNSVRYFLNLTKELKTFSICSNPIKKLWAVNEKMYIKEKYNVVFSYIEKEKYVGPYLSTQDKNDSYFRIFTIYRNLSLAMKKVKTPSAHKAQIIIDRFSMSLRDEMNAVQFLSRNLLAKKYYNQIEVAFIDSRCSDYLQNIDCIIRIVSEKMLSNNLKIDSFDIDFVDTYDFTVFPN